MVSTRDSTTVIGFITVTDTVTAVLSSLVFNVKLLISGAPLVASTGKDANESIAFVIPG